MNKTQNLKDFLRVGLAVYQPGQQAQTKYELCPASLIVKGFTDKTGKCEELSGQNTTDKRRQEILAEAHKKTITEQRLFNAARRFKEWYQAFSSHNYYENSLPAAEEKTEEAETTENGDTAKEIKEVKATAAAAELPAEEEAKSISAAMQETAAADQAEEQKAAAPEQCAAQARPKAKAAETASAP